MFKNFFNAIKKKQYSLLNLDDKALIAANKFSEYLLSHFEFDNIEIKIDTIKSFPKSSDALDYINQKESITVVKNNSSDFSIDKFLSIDNYSTNIDKLIITFIMTRNYGHLTEVSYMIGYIDNKGLIYFRNFNPYMFKNYKFNGELGIYNVKPNKHFDPINDTVHIHSSAFYIYDPIINDFSFFVYILLKKDSTYILPMRKARENFFPKKRGFQLIFKTPIIDDSNLTQTEVSLNYKNERYREFNFNINNLKDFTKAMDRALFPYNLSDEELKQIGIGSLDVKDVKNTFDEYYKIKDIVNI